MKNHQKLGLSFKIKERKNDKPHEFELEQTTSTGEISRYYIYFTPSHTELRSTVMIIHGIVDENGLWKYPKSGCNEYSFKDSVKAIGFILKKKSEKLKKGYREVEITDLSRRSVTNYFETYKIRRGI